MKVVQKLKVDNRGVGIIEVILILVVLIAIVFVFQKEINGVVTKVMSSISEDSNAIYDGAAKIKSGK